MSDRDWLFHLSERDRSTFHLALVDLCAAFERRGAWASLRDGGSEGGVVLPRAVRIDGRRRAVRLRPLEDGLSISAPATSASVRGYLQLVGATPAGFDLRSAPGLLADWRDRFGDPDPRLRSAVTRHDERIRRMVHGLLELAGLRWDRIWILLSGSGHHSFTVTRFPGQVGQLHFAARPGHPSVGGMSAELIEALDAIVAEGTHVHNGLPDDDLHPVVYIGDGYSFCMTAPPSDAVETMRALRSVPSGARLLMP